MYIVGKCLVKEGGNSCCTPYELQTELGSFETGEEGTEWPDIPVSDTCSC